MPNIDKDSLIKIQQQIDEILKSKGIEFSQLNELEKKLLREVKEKERKALADAIAQKYQKTIENFLERTIEEYLEKVVAGSFRRKMEDFLEKKMKELKEVDEKEKQKIIEAIKSVKINIEPAKVEIPDIKIPEIKVPKSEIKVDVPKIEIPKPPKVIEVKGFTSFVKAVFEVLKQKAKGIGIFEEVNRDNPLPVILVDEKGRYYSFLQTLGGGGGASGKVEVFDFPTGFYPANEDQAGIIKYYSFTDREGNWYIQKKENGNWRYVKGKGNYPTNWTNRATLEYKYLYELK